MEVINGTLNDATFHLFDEVLDEVYGPFPQYRNFVQKVNPDLEKYVTDKALEGLFKLVAEEETKIRKDPAARVSEILRQVFGGQ